MITYICIKNPCQTSGILYIIVKGIKNGWPCIVEIRGTRGCALVGDPARAVGINLTPNMYNAPAQAIVNVSNDVTIPFNTVTSQ